MTETIQNLVREKLAQEIETYRDNIFKAGIENSYKLGNIDVQADHLRFLFYACEAYTQAAKIVREGYDSVLETAIEKYGKTND
jgi:hypothetical protein